MIPEKLRSFCALCPQVEDTVAEILEHLEQVHGLKTARWPDGELVVDMSDVPELMER